MFSTGSALINPINCIVCVVCDEIIDKTFEIWRGESKQLLGKVGRLATSQDGKLISLEAWVELASFHSGLPCKEIFWLCFLP